MLSRHSLCTCPADLQATVTTVTIQDICNKRSPSGAEGKPAGGRPRQQRAETRDDDGRGEHSRGQRRVSVHQRRGAAVRFNRPNDIVVEGEDIIVVQGCHTAPRLRTFYAYRDVQL